jgi:hypothetical protein
MMLYIQIWITEYGLYEEYIYLIQVNNVPFSNDIECIYIYIPYTSVKVTSHDERAF